MTSSRNVISANAGFNRMLLGREGYVVYNPSDVYIGQSVELYGEYSEIEAHTLRQLLPTGGVAVEVGAHIGTLTLALAKAAGPKG